jgi:hypothetical protein
MDDKIRTRSEWTDKRLDDRFQQLDNAVERVDQAADNLNKLFIGFLTAAVVALLSGIIVVVIAAGVFG